MEGYVGYFIWGKKKNSVRRQIALLFFILSFYSFTSIYVRWLIAFLLVLPLQFRMSVSINIGIHIYVSVFTV